MPLRVGFLTAAHLHIGSYVHVLKHHPDAELAGLWDHDVSRGEAYANEQGLPFFPDLDTLLGRCDAVVIVSENTRHADLAVRAAETGKHILCEKPLATTVEDGERMIAAAARSGVKLMTAFPCRYHPSFLRLKERVDAGEIGKVKAVMATNRGRCPFGWFVEKEQSGGGAMIDHVVHVADLLKLLLREEPVRVQAQTSSNIYGQEWDDCAMLTLEYSSGVFATIDSSWSRPKTYKTWGDVTMNVVGENGVIELDMFGQHVAVSVTESGRHDLAGYGSNADLLMINDFVRACVEDRPSPVPGEDGLAAAKVAIAGYKSLGKPEPATVAG